MCYAAEIWQGDYSNTLKNVDFRVSVSLLYLMVAARKSMMHTRRPTRGISGCAMGSGVGMLGDVDSAYIP